MGEFVFVVLFTLFFAHVVNDTKKEVEVGSCTQDEALPEGPGRREAHNYI